MPSGASFDAGDIYRIPNLSAGALNAALVSAQDVSKWGWINLQIGNNAYAGVLTFYGSCDPDALTNPAHPSWTPVTLYRLEALNGANSSFQTSASNIIIGRPASFSFFQVLMTAYTSGSAIGTLELRKEGMPGFQLISLQAVLADSLFAKIGLINNDGLQSTPILSGVATDTIIDSNNAFLSKILVTAQNTAQMNFYDNASAGSGLIVGIVPANAAPGTIIECKAPCTNGITAGGNGNNPGVTVFFTNL